MKLKTYMAAAALGAGLLMANSANAQWTRNAGTLQTYVTNTADNVGIGTTNPIYKLDVRNAGIATMQFKSNTENANILLDKGAANKVASLNYRTAGVTNWQTGCVQNSNYTIRNFNTGTVVMHFDYVSHNVGIGTITPAAKLHVVEGAAAGDTIPVIFSKANYAGTVTDVIAIKADAATSTAAGYGIGIEALGNFIGSFASGGLIGAVGIGGSIGVDGEAIEDGNTINLTGCQGLTSGGDISVGVYGNAIDANNNYGVYGEQTDTAGPNYALVGIGDVYGWRFFQASDRKLKSNIKSLTGALEKVNKLETATYTFDHAKYPGTGLPGGQHIGFMADNIEALFPELIKTGALPTGATRDARGKVTYHSIPDVKTVNYIGLIPVLAEAIKEQKQVVDIKAEQMNARITQLENEIAELKKMLTNNKGNATETGSLLQNVPNPANGNTTISFYLPENSKGVLQVSDVAGKVVKSYNVSGSGMQDVLVNTASLSSGSYTYSLTINGKVADSKTMLINK